MINWHIGVFLACTELSVLFILTVSCYEVVKTSGVWYHSDLDELQYINTLHFTTKHRQNSINYRLLFLNYIFKRYWEGRKIWQHLTNDDMTLSQQTQNICITFVQCRPNVFLIQMFCVCWDWFWQVGCEVWDCRTRLPNAGLMLAQRLWRWANISPASGQNRPQPITVRLTSCAFILIPKALVV